MGEIEKMLYSVTSRNFRCQFFEYFSAIRNIANVTLLCKLLKDPVYDKSIVTYLKCSVKALQLPYRYSQNIVQPRLSFAFICSTSEYELQGGERGRKRDRAKESMTIRYKTVLRHNNVVAKQLLLQFASFINHLFSFSPVHMIGSLDLMPLPHIHRKRDNVTVLQSERHCHLTRQHNSQLELCLHCYLTKNLFRQVEFPIFISTAECR